MNLFYSGRLWCQVQVWGGRWYITLVVHPGRENDCKKSVKICRIRIKQDENGKEKNCDYDGKILVADDTKFCEFILEYNDTGTDAITATSKIFLQISDLWHSHNPYKPQMVPLITKTEGQLIAFWVSLSIDQSGVTHFIPFQFYLAATSTPSPQLKASQACQTRQRGFQS